MPYIRNFCHYTGPTTFNLFDDSFGAKIVGKHNADHLINTKQITMTLLIGMVKFTVALSSNGIMIIKLLISP